MIEIKVTQRVAIKNVDVFLNVVDLVEYEKDKYLERRAGEITATSNKIQLSRNSLQSFVSALSKYADMYSMNYCKMYGRFPDRIPILLSGEIMKNERYWSDNCQKILLLKKKWFYASDELKASASVLGEQPSIFGKLYTLGYNVVDSNYHDIDTTDTIVKFNVKIIHSRKSTMVKKC